MAAPYNNNNIRNTTSAKGRWLCFYLCLFVCLSARLLRKLWMDYDKILEGWGVDQVINRLDFGADLVRDLNPVIF